MNIGITVEGLDAITEGFDKYNEEFTVNLKKAVAREAEDIAEDARGLCPTDTGHLKQNIFTRVIEDSEGISGEVYTDVKYGAYVEFGTGQKGEEAGLVREGIDLAYTQEPWTYYSEELGHFVTTTGQKPQPFLYPAMKQHEDSLKENLGATARMESIVKW